MLHAFAQYWGHRNRAFSKERPFLPCRKKEVAWSCGRCNDVTVQLFSRQATRDPMDLHSSSKLLQHEYGLKHKIININGEMRYRYSILKSIWEHVFFEICLYILSFSFSVFILESRCHLKSVLRPNSNWGWEELWGVTALAHSLQSYVVTSQFASKSNEDVGFHFGKRWYSCWKICFDHWCNIVKLGTMATMAGGKKMGFNLNWQWKCRGGRN